MKIKTVAPFQIICRLILLLLIVLGLNHATPSHAEANTNNLPGWLTKPLSLTDALNLSLQQNRGIKKSQRDIEAAHGVSLQTRAIAVPKLQASGSYTATDPAAAEQFFANQTIVDQNWDASIR